jgi:hypothetical protein
MNRPTLHDRDGWAIQLLEHRRALFERVVQSFPELLKQRRSDVDLWRIKLKPPRSTPGNSTV